jgi:hypothetical protein
LGVDFLATAIALAMSVTISLATTTIPTGATILLVAPTAVSILLVLAVLAVFGLVAAPLLLAPIRLLLLSTQKTHNV